MAQDQLLAELAAALPDIPRWVAPRGLLLEGRCEILLGPEGKRGAGYLVLEHGGREAFAVHRPVASLVAQFARLTAPAEKIFAPIESAEPWRELLPGWGQQPAVVHVHPAPAALPKPAHAARFLTLDDVSRLGDLPGELAQELPRALARGPVAAAFEGTRAVSFCSAPYRTETWFDLSLDTLPEHRRAGYADVRGRVPDPPLPRAGQEAGVGRARRGRRLDRDGEEVRLPRGRPDDGVHRAREDGDGGALTASRGSLGGSGAARAPRFEGRAAPARRTMPVTLTASSPSPMG